MRLNSIPICIRHFFMAFTGLLVVAVLACQLYPSTASSFPKNNRAFQVLQWLPHAKPLPEVQLQSSTGETVSTKALKGHWTLVFMGFTHCADICPIEVNNLNRLLYLADTYHISSLNALFVSIDPERDNVHQLQVFAEKSHSRFMFARTDAATIAQLTAFFAIPYAKESTQGNNIPVNSADSGYSIIHSGRIFLIDNNTEYRGSFSPPYDQKKLWQDLQMILR